MRENRLIVFFVLVVGGCGGAGRGGGGAGTVGKGSAGTTGTTGASGTTGTAGASGTTGTAGASGTTGTAGAGGTTGMAGTGGTGGGGAAGTGGGAGRWTCPAGPFTAPTPARIALTKVAGVPPLDGFNNNGAASGNIEGDCWLGDALYVSEIADATNPPPARILRVTPAGAVSVAVAASGTNGLAIDLLGRLVGASHTAGGILAFDLASMASTPVVTQYMGSRFNTPNDLTVRGDGTIYFTDPDFQAPSPLPQASRRVYRLPPGATDALVVDAARSNPNGITLSLDEAFLFVTDTQGLYRYPVNPDGSTGTATRIAQTAVTTGDGMGIDCLGNLYVASRQSVVVVEPSGAGTSLGTIPLTSVRSVTNVAFGGANRQTLYVSGLGKGMGATAMGLYSAQMPLPGMPY